MENLKRWVTYWTLALLVAATLGVTPLEDSSSAVKEEAPTACSYCIIYDRDTGETIQYWYEDPEGSLELEGCACDCE